MGSIARVRDDAPELVECTLYAEFDVVLSDIGWCPLVDLDPPIDVQAQQVQAGTCLIDARVRNDEDYRTVRIKQECDRKCPSETLTTHGYMPQLKKITPDRVVIGVSLDRREDVGDVVGLLRSTAEQVSLRKLSDIGDDSPVGTSVLDLTELTTKQRETVTYAISEGYYRQPRRISISTMATKFDVSPATISKRLSRVESKVMRDVFDVA